jgi:cytochrome oxidase Cu insertion factor (SCO1/SenC/PrrC family)
MRRFFRRIGLPLVFLAMAGFFVYRVTREPAVVWDKAGQESSIATTVSIGGPFRLVDSQGAVRTDREFRGKYLLVYFGYTFCPDICPLALSNISQALPLLGNDRDQVVPIFITLDPERDTQSALRDYSSHFHPNIVMLTGTPQQLAPVMKAYHAYGVKAEDDKTTDYVMDHSTLIYLMDRHGRFLRFFPHTTPGRELADGVLAALTLEHK